MDIGIDKNSFNKNIILLFKFNKFLIWILGIWPLESENLFTWIRFGFTIISQIWMIIVQIIIIFMKCLKLNDEIDVISLISCSLIAISKCFAIRIYMDDIRTVFHFIFDNWMSIKDDKRLTILQPFIRISKFVSIWQIILSYLTVIIISFSPLTVFILKMSSNRNYWNSTPEISMRQLPLKTGCLFAELQDEIYVSMFIFESIIIFMCCQGVIGCDIFIFNATLYLCGIIELLKTDILNIKGNVKNPKKLNDDIMGLIKRHEYVLQIAQKLNKTISGSLILQIALNAGLNLLLGIRLLMAIKWGLSYIAMRALLSLTVLFFQLYLTSYAGDLLMHQTESISNSLYCSNWYELPINLQKKLYFMSMRANKPVYRIAGGFYEIHIQNFKSIVKTSFSYFSILRLIFNM